MQPPVTREDGHTRLTTSDDISSSGTGKEASVAEALWDDEDTKSFYENLPNLRAFVPAVLLGEAEQKANDQSSKSQDQATDSAVDPDQGQVVADETGETSADAGVMPDRKNEKKKDEDEKDKGSTKESDKGKGKEKEKDGEIEKEKL